MPGDEQNRKQLEERGFVIVRGLLDRGEAAAYRGRLEAVAAEWELEGSGRRTLADGVVKRPEFWDLIWHPRLLDVVRGLLGDAACFAHHTDLHAGFSALAWHRDSMNRRLGDGPEWSLKDPPFQMLRAGIYLQSFAESGFCFGVIPGSHHAPTRLTTVRRLGEALQLRLHSSPRLGSLVQNAVRNAVWIRTEPGDAVVFDPRLLHCGRQAHGTKYSMFVGYGVENVHFHNYEHYFQAVRRDLQYGPLPEALGSELARRGLLASAPGGPVSSVAAWRP